MLFLAVSQAYRDIKEVCNLLQNKLYCSFSYKSADNREGGGKRECKKR
jgi:hypothetical protein